MMSDISNDIYFAIDYSYSGTFCGTYVVKADNAKAAEEKLSNHVLKFGFKIIRVDQITKIEAERLRIAWSEEACYHMIE